MIDHFSPKTIEALKHYVYVYSDPDTHQPFYIGKGKGNRVFSHLKEISESKKVQKINEIIGQGKMPIIEILAHGLDNKTAERVEAAAIDLIGVEKLTNIQRGHESSQYGIVDVNALEAKYRKDELKECDITDNVMMININKRYRYDMTPFELYESTRGYWRVNREKAENIDFVLAVYRGIVLEVYQVADWYDAMTTLMDSRADEIVIDKDADSNEGEHDTRRSEFVGRIAPEAIRKKYVYRSVEGFYENGQRNPIRYIFNSHGNLR